MTDNTSIMDITTPEHRQLFANAVFAQLIEHGSDGAFLVRDDGRIAYVNSNMQSLLGYDMADFIGATFTDFWTPEFRMLGTKRHRQRINGEHPTSRYEIEMLKKDGSILPIEITASVFAVDGGGVFDLCMARDISMRRRMESDLRENAERYRDLFDNANDLIQDFSADGKILHANRTWHATLGYDRADIANLTVFDIIQPQERDYFLNIVYRAASGVAVPPVNITFLTKDGRAVILEGDISARIVDGRASSIRGIFRNVSEHIDAERRIQELASIVEHGLDAIVITDPTGLITYVNESWQRLNGWAAAEVVGIQTSNIFRADVQDPAVFKNLWNTIGAGSIFSGEMVNRRKDGTLYPAEVTILPLKDKAERITGFAGFLHDITKRRKAERQLHEEKDYAERIVEEAGVIIVILDEDGRIDAFNRTAEEVTGYRRDDVIGKNWFETIVPRERYPDVWKAFQAFKTTHAISHYFENPILSAQGNERVVGWTNGVISRGEGELHAISFGIDITDRVAIEAELVQKNEYLERFKELTVGRELKMIELKKELAALRKSNEPSHEEADAQ